MPGKISGCCLVFVAFLAQAACQICNANLYKAPCGHGNVSLSDCEASNCCFNPPSSGVIAPQCFYPANAEISAYVASSEAASGEAIVEDGGSAGNNTCQWGQPVLEPTPRATDTWGIGWVNIHDIEVMEMMTADRLDGFDLIFFGDSITEIWRGTSGGAPFKRSDGSFDNTTFVPWDMRAVFWDAFGSRYRAGVMAIAGDQIGHLWWRLLNGQLPAGKKPQVAVVLIGTNDLYAMANCLASEAQLIDAVYNITMRFAEMLGAMRQGMPGTHIVVQGLFPRGADFGDRRYVWPNEYTFALGLLNSYYEEITEFDPLMHYVYCGEGFLMQTQDGIAQDLLPDGLHPGPEGLKVVARCLLPLLEELMPSNVTEESRPADDVTVHNLLQSNQHL